MNKEVQSACKVALICGLNAVKEEILEFAKRAPQSESSEVITKKHFELQSAIAEAGYSVLKDVNRFRNYGSLVHVMESNEQSKDIDYTIDGARIDICQRINMRSPLKASKLPSASRKSTAADAQA